MSNSAQQQVDQERVREMRRLMSEGGYKAVEHKFGEGAKQSAEFRLVQRQREAQARRAREQREKAASEQQAKEQSKARRESSLDKAKESEREKDKQQEAPKDKQQAQSGPTAAQGTQSSEKAPEGVPEKVKVSQRDRMMETRREEKSMDKEQVLSR